MFSRDFPPEDEKSYVPCVPGTERVSVDFFSLPLRHIAFSSGFLDPQVIDRFDFTKEAKMRLRSGLTAPFAHSARRNDVGHPLLAFPAVSSFF